MRIGDCLHATFTPDPGRYANFSNTKSYVMAAVELYRTTGEAKYLDWAHRLADYYLLPGGFVPTRLSDHGCEIIGGLGLLFAVAVEALGGPGPAWRALDEVSPTCRSWLPVGLGLGDVWGPVLFIVGWLFAGYSVAGQPHIMVRFMALDHPDQTNRARLYYYAWFVTFYVLANGVGLLSRVLLPTDAAFDPELALPTLAMDLLPAPLVGLILAGVFAATMSTADSLILSCSGNLSEDFVPADRRPVALVKGATILTTLLALVIALYAQQSVFGLVVASWAVMAAAFAPLLTVYAFGGRPSEALCVAMLVSGVASVWVWKQFAILGDYYEGALGILVGLAVYAVGSRFARA